MRPVADRLIELVVGHDAVDDADALGLGGRDLLAEQQQLGRLLARDVAVEQRRDHEREQTDVDLRRAEARALPRDDQVAGERQPERPGEHVTAGGADRRLAELAEQPEELREALVLTMLVEL